MLLLPLEVIAFSTKRVLSLNIKLLKLKRPFSSVVWLYTGPPVGEIKDTVPFAIGLPVRVVAVPLISNPISG